ncbi:hypothetical protein WME90_12270 [Sorangium sp. So ce375]|uniref:hypothetical protein n=1 Tax=Sorangium sp. So ce375 TaxID=3133306 RepID=UPI003F5BD56F
MRNPPPNVAGRGTTVQAAANGGALMATCEELHGCASGPVLQRSCRARPVAVP